jgi:hypothetical protein
MSGHSATQNTYYGMGKQLPIMLSELPLASPFWQDRQRTKHNGQAAVCALFHSVTICDQWWWHFNHNLLPWKPMNKMKSNKSFTAYSAFLTWTKKKTRGVSHCGLAIYIKKYLKAKEEHWKHSNISPCKNIIFQKSSGRNQSPSRYYYNSITNLKFQHKLKCLLSKILI